MSVALSVVDYLGRMSLRLLCVEQRPDCGAIIEQHEQLRTHIKHHGLSYFGDFEK